MIPFRGDVTSAVIVAGKPFSWSQGYMHQGNNKLTLLSSTLNRSTLLIHSMRIPSFGLQVIQCHGRGIDSLLLTRNLHMPSVNFMVARVGVL
jgi:hypothetical protein